MAKTESTAVNKLIELVQTQQHVGGDPERRRGPPKPPPGPTRMTATVPPIAGAGEVAPLPRHRTPRGTQRSSSPAVRVSTAPGTVTIPPLPRPSAPPPPRTAPADPLADSLTTGALALALGAATERDLGTARVAKGTDWGALLPKLVVPAIAVVAVGVLVGVYIAHERARDRAQPAPEAAAAAIATPTVTPTSPATKPAARVALVDVRIDSVPSGASVSIVDHGKTSFLGTTPLRSSLDASREYDLVFTRPGAAARTEHLAPARSHRVAVKLVPAGDPAPAAAASRRDHHAHHHHHHASTPVAAAPETPPAAAPPAAAPPSPPPSPPPAVEAPPPPAAPTGKGVLMISSKPPSEILIDGVSTGLFTPQRAIRLAAGTHKVTLVNATDQIKKTVTVEIHPDHPTKVIQNLMP